MQSMTAHVLFAREARVQRRDRAYHEAFEAHDPMILHVREAFDCPVSINISATLYLEPLKQHWG